MRAAVVSGAVLCCYQLLYLNYQMKNRCVRTADMMLLVCNIQMCQQTTFQLIIKLLTFQLNAAERDAYADVVDAAFEIESAVVGAEGRVLNGCLYGDYSRDYPIATTSPPVGI